MNRTFQGALLLENDLVLVWFFRSRGSAENVLQPNICTSKHSITMCGESNVQHPGTDGQTGPLVPTGKTYTYRLNVGAEQKPAESVEHSLKTVLTSSPQIWLGVDSFSITQAILQGPEKPYKIEYSIAH